jgi:broad specificity phosphatase PhoE
MEIVWIRHGEPERIAPGSGVAADPRLTTAGREQAQRLAEWLAHDQLDAVLTSPLRRAVETAEPIGAALGVEVETFEGIVEYDRESDHYIPTEELRVTKDERWTAMVEGRWDEFGAELPEIFRARVDEAVNAIVDRFPGQRVAAVCHGGVINVAIGSVLGIPQPLWFEPHYTSMSRMLASRGGIRSVASLNELAHLQAARRDGRG